MPTLEENVNRVKAAKTAIGNAITAKGGTVGANDGLEDFASDIATIPSGGFEYANSPTNFTLKTNLLNYEVNVPEGCTSIEPFSGVEGLKRISLANSITSLPTSCFKNCINIESISLSNSITEIPSGTFQRCLKLKEVVIPHSVSFIANNVFSNNENSILEKIYIDNVENSISGSPWGAPTQTKVIWIKNRYTSAVNEVSQGTTLTTSVSCTVGDLIVATFETLGSEYTLPSGWILLGDSGEVSTGGYTQRTGMAYKIAESTTESFTLTQTSSSRIFTNLIAITGASIGTFSGFTKNETNNTITATKPQGLVIWAISTMWWGSKWEVTPNGDKVKISTKRCENFLDQSNDTTVTFTTDTTQSAGGLAYASLTITGIDNFWYYDEPQT